MYHPLIVVVKPSLLLRVMSGEARAPFGANATYYSIGRAISGNIIGIKISIMSRIHKEERKRTTWASVVDVARIEKGGEKESSGAMLMIYHFAESETPLLS